jgi:transcriptional regulator with XRE-family HTH domain
MARLAKNTVITKKQVGERIRDLRRQRGMSQEELGNALGLTQSNVSAIERGDRGPTIYQVGRFAKVLGVSTDEIIGNGKPPAETKSNRPRLLRRLERIQELPVSDQRAVLKFLDALLAKHGRDSRRK